MQQKLISDYKFGDTVVSFLIVRKKEVRQKKTSGEAYLKLEFGDCSGRIQGTLWENIDRVKNNIHSGEVVKIKGKIISYMDKPHLTVEKIRPATKEDNIDPQQFLPVTPQNCEKMFTELKAALAVIKDQHLDSLIKLFLSDKQFVKDFCQAPAGKLWHHAYLGGLLEHTLSVVKISSLLIEHYQDLVKGDILLTASFLHDIGKIEEFTTEGFINYSTTGRLIGHINIGFELIEKKISQIKNFPGQLKNQLVHCILSHHGEKEKGSPVVPKTKEALILYYADELDSSMGAFQRIILKEKEPRKIWSNYVNLIDRFIYFGEEE